MEYYELIEGLKDKLVYLIKKVKKNNWYFDENDLLQEIYLYLWIEWKNGNLKDKNKSYILKGCYFYLKNFIRKNGNNKILSLEEMEEKYVFPKKMEDIKKYDELTLYEEIYEVLNEREKKVLNLLIEGYTTREIGKILGVSHVMVIKIIKKIKNKLIETKIEI